MRPMIGVMPLWDEQKGSIWMLPGYMDGVSGAGATPIIFPFSRDEEEVSRLVEKCDGILLTGGPDISPEIYGEKRLGEMVQCCGKRDVLELAALKAAMEKEKPVLGICRGIQLINAALGGTLYQDLPLQHPSETRHRQDPPFEAPTHNVVIREGTPLWECLDEGGQMHLQGGILGVNSLHHQAVRKIAPVLEEMAVSEDGITEALYMPEYHFLWAVQWHPEYMCGKDLCSRKIFRAFVEAASNN